MRRNGVMSTPAGVSTRIVATGAFRQNENREMRARDRQVAARAHNNYSVRWLTSRLSIVSDDAGRYVCNLTLFESLRLAHARNNAPGGGGGGGAASSPSFSSSGLGWRRGDTASPPTPTKGEASSPSVSGSAGAADPRRLPQQAMPPASGSCP